jgi:hypothetical protein
MIHEVSQGFALAVTITPSGDAGGPKYSGYGDAKTVGLGYNPTNQPCGLVLDCRQVCRRRKQRSGVRAGILAVKIALGLKAHSGWAALVAVGSGDGELCVVDRLRVELVEEADAQWAKQPYHAAEFLKPAEARAMVRRGVEAAHRHARREIEAALHRSRQASHEIVACAVLVGELMPNWSVEEILAVHFRMHKAEGVLFRDALARAAEACGLNLVAIPEKFLTEHAERMLATPLNALMKTIATLGKSVGSPWGKDQKDAALAAMIGLNGPE